MLQIARNPDWIFRVDDVLWMVILFGRLSCQSAQQAEELTFYFWVSEL